MLEFRDLFTVSCLFFFPYSSVLDTYQLEFQQILEISQERKDQITVYFDSFAFYLIKSAAFFGLFDSLFFANPWPNLNPGLISLPRETNLKFGKYFPFPFGR